MEVNRQLQYPRAPKSAIRNQKNWEMERTGWSSAATLAAVHNTARSAPTGGSGGRK